MEKNKIINETETLETPNEKFAECWCCKHFVLREKTLEGGCGLHWRIVSAHQVVCPDFILNDGIFIKRKIPDYCINYQNKENKNG